MLRKALPAVVCFLVLVTVCVDGQRDNLPTKFRLFVEVQESVVKTIAQRASELHARRVQLVRECECSTHACSNNFPQASCVQHLGTPDICKAEGRLVDNTTSMFRTPPGTHPGRLPDDLKESICVYKHMEDTAKKFGQEEYGWIFIGTPDGHFRRYPATARPRGEENGDALLGGCRTYDPRIRPWYISASTGPKDLVIIVDKSGSMNDLVGVRQETKWDLTDRAVRDILGTFTFADFVNVVTFSDKASPLWTASGLVRCTFANIESLQSLVQKEIPRGNTNFKAAFESAFRLLTKCGGQETCSNCEKVILFLTDGKDTSGQDPESMASLIETLQSRLEDASGKRASIFTYSMSKQADDAIPRQIACANNGAWSFIGPKTNTLDALNSYYLYFAARRSETPIWVEPYLDAGGLGMVTTVAMPFFAFGTDKIPDVFLGVVGHTVGFHELQIDGLTEREALNALIDRSARCSTYEVTPCETQVYRNVRDRRALCPDRFPVGRPGSENCFAGSATQVYKRFVAKLEWEEAVARCEDDGGELVSIANEAELAFSSNLADVSGSWIGARSGSGTSFSWVDRNVETLEEGSSFWGVQEPLFAGGSAPWCAAIDSRGIINNLFSSSCTDKRSFICRYPSAEACSDDGVKSVPANGFFRVPPVSSCHQEEIEDETHPIPEVNRLTSDAVMCNRGDQKTTEGVTCCPVEDDDPIEKKAWFWLALFGGTFALTWLLAIVVYAVWIRGMVSENSKVQLPCQ